MNKTKQSWMWRSIYNKIVWWAQNIIYSRSWVLNKKSSKPINDVLFYGTGAKESGLTNMQCIYYILEKSRHTIDLCIPKINDPLVYRLIAAHKKNKVRVRIIVNKGCDLVYLKQIVGSGLYVKIVEATQKIAYQFVLVDDNQEENDRVVILGSLEPSLVPKEDAVYFISEQAVVDTLRREFDRVWNSISSIDVPSAFIK